MKDQNTAHFTVAGTTVTGSGSTASGQTDYFYGQNNVGYNVTIAGGANLYNTGANPSGEPPLLTSSGTPYNEVIYMSYGTLTNNGTLTTYPQPLANKANNYHKSPAVVFINNTAAHPSQVINNGTIGDFPAVSNKSNPFYSYDQENDVGVFLYYGTITNNRGALLTGYNAVFTKGSGTLNNYGTIVGNNDGALTAFVVNNYANASLSNGVAGFACIHAYNTVNNYGYMLGQDYGILADGGGFSINDYGGQAVAGVKNFDGSQVYNGEISALQRGNELPRTSGPFLTLDAIMLDTSGSTVNLMSTTVNNVVYLPVILGPMEGGFNGDYASASAHVLNTLNFNFSGISTTQADGLKTAIAQSLKSGPNGHYYSGSFTLNGHFYQWEDFAEVEYNGTPVQGATPTPTPKPTATATVGGLNIVSSGGGTLQTTTGANGHSNSASLSFLDIGLMVTGLLFLILIAVVSYRLLSKRLRRKRIANQPTQKFDLNALANQNQES